MFAPTVAQAGFAPTGMSVSPGFTPDLLTQPFIPCNGALVKLRGHGGKSVILESLVVPHFLLQGLSSLGTLRNHAPFFAQHVLGIQPPNVMTEGINLKITVVYVAVTELRGHTSDEMNIVRNRLVIDQERTSPS